MSKLKTLLSIAVLVLIAVTGTKAQTPENAGEYMTAVSAQYREITKDYMKYASAVAHGKSARKVENLRKELLKTTQQSKSAILAMKSWKGDSEYRDSAVSYLTLSLIVLKEDYDKILNMEEIAEQSYDNMEAYLLAQDLANEKMNKASDKLDVVEKAFAAKHGVNLIESSDKLSQKMEQTSKTNKYYRVIYLIFYKSYKQEAYLVQALNKKDINGIEQNRNSLIKTAEEGLKRLDTIKAFEGDMNLVNACRELLKFYVQEAKNDIPQLTDFLVKEETFNKVKKAFDSKPAGDRTQQDVDEFNKSVNEFNAGVNKYNSTNNTINTNRSKFTDGWNKGTDKFLASHVPKY